MNEIIVKDQHGDTEIQLSQGLLNARDIALYKAKMVVEIKNASDLEAASIALGEIKSLGKTITGAHKDAKEPFLKITRQLDSIKKEFVESLSGEELRLSRMIGAHQEAERRKAEEARRAAEEEKRRILFEQQQKERDRLAAEKQQWDETGTTTGTLSQDLGAIRDETAERIVAADNQAAQVATLAASGTSVRKVWDFECVDVHMLAGARPDLVTITPNKAAIKAILKATNGAPIPGIRSWCETKATVKSAPITPSQADNYDF